MLLRQISFKSPKIWSHPCTIAVVFGGVVLEWYPFWSAIAVVTSPVWVLTPSIFKIPWHPSSSAAVDAYFNKLDSTNKQNCNVRKHVRWKYHVHFLKSIIPQYELLTILSFKCLNIHRTLLVETKCTMSTIVALVRCIRCRPTYFKPSSRSRALYWFVCGGTH